MASLLENLFDYLENERHQDAAKIREKAQEEFFKAKNKLGLQERKETGKIDALFSSLEKGHHNEAKSLLDKAREEYKKHISAYVHLDLQSDLKEDTATKDVNAASTNNSCNSESKRQRPRTDNNTGFEQLVTSDEELKRASKDASEKMRKDNPNIADLSDANRPTRTAERFSELYDNEWTEAYVDLTDKQKLPKRKAVEILYKTVLAAYDFCLEEAKLQIKLIQDAALSVLKYGDVKKSAAPSLKLDTYPLVQFRKDIAEIAVERLKKTFIDAKVNPYCNTKSSGPVKTFAASCVEITWWMCVQNPPVYMFKGELGPVNQSLYKPYTKSGETVEYYVWPPLLLYERGPILSKGVVQAS